MTNSGGLCVRLQQSERDGIPLDVTLDCPAGEVLSLVGPSGSGKSTTTTLTGQLLQSAGFHTLVGGNIGVPLCAQVDLSTPETLHVVETSSFQLEQTETFRPWIAVLLNLSPDHLDRHPDISSYRAAKARIHRGQSAISLRA